MSQHAPFADKAQCSDAAIREFIKGVNEQLWRSNALMVANAVLVAIMVLVGASGRRYRHAAATRFLFLGASTLYLPIVSYVASSVGKETWSTSGLDVLCYGRLYVTFLLIWTLLVQIVGSNTSAIVAPADYYGGQKLGLSIELLARAVWTSYLVLYYEDRGFSTIVSKDYYILGKHSYYKVVSRFLSVLCLLSLAKIVLKVYAFQKARRSFAHGRRNPHLIAGYMEKLKGDEAEVILPLLIVMGEDEQEIEETPYGYCIKQKNNKLVTLDMVWRMAATGDALLSSRPCLKDLCLSFALFKLLTRRFAKTHIAESGSAKAFSFVMDALLNHDSPERVFNVIADDISFVRESCYSSLPASNSGRLLPILNTAVSLLVINWCLAVGAYTSHYYAVYTFRHPYQIYCRPNPIPCKFPPQYLNDRGVQIAFGNILFNALPTFCLFVAAIIAEAWEMVSYLCSNWFKVTMLCYYVTHASWQQSPRVKRWLVLVMKLRINFGRSWSDQMGQVSLLPEMLGHQSQPISTQSGLISRLFRLTDDPKVHRVKVPPGVVAAIVEALRNSNGGILSRGMAALHKSRIGGDILWACQGRGTSDVMLVWHIASGILEASHGESSSTSSKRVVAMHLSRYCVYLVAAAPELLPDDRAWSRKLHETVSRDIRRMGERSEHEVVKRGVRLGKQLMDLIPDEEARWDLLASFWSEMLLYAAPSDNLKAHKKAIAHGTELVTLIWALLTHAGIVTRPSTTNTA